LPRRVLDGLRRAGELIRAPNLVRAVMIDKSLDPADRQSFARVQWKVRDTLDRLKKRGLVAPDGETEQYRASPPRNALTVFLEIKFIDRG
jgi:hypothetical protein